MMFKNKLLLLVIFFSVSIVAQKTSSKFNAILDSLKKKDNYAEFIYIHLEEFVKNPTIENITIFEQLSTRLWRSPKNEKEATSQLYFYINYAYHLKQFGFIDQSIINYENGYNCYKKNKIKNYDIIEFCLKPLANNYTRLGDVDRAEDILKITIEKAQEEKRNDQIIAGYSNLASVFRTKGAFDVAINYLNLALNLSTSKLEKSRIYSDLAINFLLLGDFKKAEENVDASNRLNTINDLAILTRNEKTLGACFVEKQEFNKALIEFEKALKNAIAIFGKNDREVAKIYNQIAVVYSHKKEWNQAQKSYQKSLGTLLPSYLPKSIFENPPSTYFYSENTLKDAFDGRANVFTELGNYKEALNNYELSFLIEDELRTSYLTQNAKLNQQQENRNRSEKCIDLCYELYKETNNIQWLEKAFQFAEKTKSAVLLETKDLSWKKSILKNDSLFLKEEKLLFNKAQLNKNITIEQLKNEAADVDLLANLTKKRDAVFTDLQLLKQQIETKYPQLKTVNNTPIKIKDIQNKLLRDSQVFMEFFDGKSNVYIFTISKKYSISIDKIEKDAVFNEEVLAFLKLFSEDRGTALKNDIRSYTALGFKLFKKLFKAELGKEIILVPDGLFSFLPFDALMTQNTSITNFEKLPYLLKKSNISYAYSATILLQTKIEKSNKKNVIGFFPIFKNNHRNLSELTYTEEESEGIKNLIKGDFLLDSKASKTAFNKTAANYSIIHLSTHATAGDYYAPPAIEFYDETLYLPEIYGYNLQTDLLVLSACETGIGMLRKGEGAMSLARGFSYAGVQNLIVSLWKVNDKSTEKLMTEFYKNYKKSGDKSEALYHSKLSYLSDEKISANKKSPYYWASFVFIGEANSDGNNTFGIGWYVLLGFLLIGSYFLFKKSKFGQNS